MTDLEILADEFGTVWRVLKATNTELQAYKETVKALLKAHPELTETVNDVLTVSRRLPVLHETMNPKYELVLETLLRKFSDSLPAIVLTRLEGLENS